MRAWMLDGRGYDNLVLLDNVPRPEVGAHDVLIKSETDMHCSKAG